MGCISAVVRRVSAVGRTLGIFAESPVDGCTLGIFAESPAVGRTLGIFAEYHRKRTASHLWIVNVHGTFFQSTKRKKIDNN